MLEIPERQVRAGFTAPRTFSGDHTVVETPVPIPNTVVKHPGPMIVRALAKVGIARFFKNPVGTFPRGFCLRAQASSANESHRLCRWTL